MNFSQPGSAAPTSSSPLSLARSLFSGLDDARPDVSAFTGQLTAIHHAAYLLLLPHASLADADFHKAEAARLTHGPLGDQILHVSSLFFFLAFRAAVGDDGQRARQQTQDIYEATDAMLQELAKERETYLDNMALLLADMKLKWKADLEKTGSWHHVALTLGPWGIASAQALSDLVGARALPPPHRRCLHRKTYLSDLARHWRTWAANGGPYEEIWTYVAGRTLRME